MTIIRVAALAAVAALCAAATAATAADDKDGWKPLFNGKDLDGWDTWLGKPRGEKDAIGLNKDPKKVYTIVEKDGKPTIRISGEIFGALTSKDEFENYHLKLQFKWGEKKWPPRESAVRDSGLLYHCVGPQGAGGPAAWMKSQELQIQEHDCGDYWSVGGAMVDVEADPIDSKPGANIHFKRGGTSFSVPRTVKAADGKERTVPRIVKSLENEKAGEWNTIELLCVGGTSVHVVNGKVNMVLTKSRHKVDGKEQPLTKGKIQIQSEGAEVFYRDIAVRPLKEIPAEYLK